MRFTIKLKDLPESCDDTLVQGQAAREENLWRDLLHISQLVESVFSVSTTGNGALLQTTAQPRLGVFSSQN